MARPNLGGWIVAERFRAFWPADDRPVSRRAGFASMPGEKMGYQCIDLSVFAARQLGIFGK